VEFGIGGGDYFQLQTKGGRINKDTEEINQGTHLEL